MKKLSLLLKDRATRLFIIVCLMAAIGSFFGGIIGKALFAGVGVYIIAYCLKKILDF